MGPASARRLSLGFSQGALLRAGSAAPRRRASTRERGFTASSRPGAARGPADGTGPSDPSRNTDQGV